MEKEKDSKLKQAMKGLDSFLYHCRPVRTAY